MNHVATWVLIALGAVCAACGGVSVPSSVQWPTAEVEPWSSEARFAVTVNLEDEIAFVPADGVRTDAFGAAKVGNIPVELEGPHHLASSPDGKWIYFNLSNYTPGTGSGPHGSHGTGTIPGSLVKLDARTARKVGEVIVDRSPGDVVLSADGKYAYVTHYDLIALMRQLTMGGPPEDAFSTVAVVETATMRRLALIPVCVTPHGAGLSASGTTLYVTCSQSDEVGVVDVTDPTHPVATARVPVGPSPGPYGEPRYFPYALAVSPKDGSVWISNNTSGDVRVFDPATGAMDSARTVFVGGVAMFGAFSPDGKTFYVPHQGDDRLSAIDTATLAIRNLAPPAGACLNAHAFVLDPTGAFGVMVCEGDHMNRQGTVVTIAVTPFVTIGFTQVGLFPDGAAWLPPAP
jgi:DNA-binding beta-propeller fold protein YncE